MELIHYSFYHMETWKKKNNDNICRVKCLPSKPVLMSSWTIRRAHSLLLSSLWKSLWIKIGAARRCTEIHNNSWRLFYTFCCIYFTVWMFVDISKSCKVNSAQKHEVKINMFIKEPCDRTSHGQKLLLTLNIDPTLSVLFILETIL